MVIRINKSVHKWMNNCPITLLGSISLMYISQTLNTLKELYKQRVVTSNPWWKCALNVGIHQPIDPRPSGTESQGPHPMCDANAAAHTPSCVCESHGFFRRHASKRNMFQHHFCWERKLERKQTNAPMWHQALLKETFFSENKINSCWNP